jgi:hypothetical protein
MIPGPFSCSARPARPDPLPWQSLRVSGPLSDDKCQGNGARFAERPRLGAGSGLE